MKLIIELGDTLYNFIKEHKLMVMDLQTIEKAIKDGTILPKGHGRLIDADELIKDYGNPDIEILLENMDTIIEADKEAENDT